MKKSSFVAIVMAAASGIWQSDTWNHHRHCGNRDSNEPDSACQRN